VVEERKGYDEAEEYPSLVKDQNLRINSNYDSSWTTKIENSYHQDPRDFT